MTSVATKPLAKSAKAAAKPAKIAAKPAKIAAKPAKIAAKPVLRGKLVRVMTPEERSADIKAFGKEIRKNKASAIAFLKQAGILDDSGELAEPYRA